ncbi:MAG: DUF4173 domain-containing protein [Oscillospiraceae bacterium]|nr:DUF4173 domain-containing protein [Oscillospiraceae bacterium]
MNEDMNGSYMPGNVPGAVQGNMPDTVPNGPMPGAYGNVPPYGPMPTYIPKIIPKEYTKRETIFAFIAAVIGYLAVRCAAVPFLNGEGIGLGASLIVMLCIVWSCVYTHKRDSLHILRMAVASCFAVNAGICSMWLIQGLDVIFAMMILFYDRFAVSHDSVRRIRRTFFSDLFTAWCISPVRSMGDMPRAIRWGTRGRMGTGAKNLIIGLFIALPSTIVVALLLSSADDGFAAIMEDLFDNAFVRILTTVFYIAIGIPAAMYLFGASYSASHREDAYEEKDLIGESGRIIPAAAGVVSAVPLCVMYVIFFCSQLSHYMSSFINVLPTGETYAAYARQGFFELCFVALIDLAVIVVLDIFCTHKEGKKTVGVRAITVVLCVFTLMLIATALAKMAMYIRVYGLTQLRTYTSWCMILLALIFIIIAVHVFNDRSNAPRAIAVVFTVMFAALSFSNTDALIARYDMDRYLDGSLPYFNITDM